MNLTPRTVYVISDLHLGGRTAGEIPNDAGFRMMRNPHHLAVFVGALAKRPTTPTRIELIINGDFIDFLAEQLPEDGERWVPFRAIPGDALRVLEQVLVRPCDREVVAALTSLLAKGHDLTVMLGNHDIELALPEVRSRFEEEVRAWSAPGRLSWIIHNAAYLVGDALIEHGNRYDPANLVDHDALRRLCSLRSRWLFANEPKAGFVPPPGSQFVAEFMNPLKSVLPFVDLLKPESEPLFALVAALRPDARGRILELVHFARRAVNNRYDDPVSPADGCAVSAVEGNRLAGEGGPPSDDDGVDRVLDILGVDADERIVFQQVFREAVDAPQEGAIVASVADHVRATTVLATLFAGGSAIPYKSRLGLAQKAMKLLAGDSTFDRNQETNKAILAAAERLTQPRLAEDLGTMPSDVGRPRFVVFGHTHHAKSLPLRSGARYLNTGTWAGLITFPDVMLQGDAASTDSALSEFVLRLTSPDVGGLVEFNPTYVRLDVDEAGRVTHGELYDYDWEHGLLTDPV